MLYTAQWPPSTSNNLHFDFLEPNNNLNNDSSSSSTGSGSGSVKNRGQDLDCVMTGASISVVTSSNAATLPYTAGDTAGGVGVGVGVGGGVDDISPTGIKMAQQEGMALGEDCNGGMGMGMGCDSGSPAPPQSLTLRLIMQGKEVGSIIGKRGDTIKKFRTESGARINISDGQSIERIVTLTGANECLNKAFAMISYKFEEDMSEGLTADCPKPPVTLRLIVPASQCGSIIGKGGSKIKEIREHTGCTIQVAGDYLPHSTERAVTISGMPEAITKCIMEICKIMAESPPKGQTLPYRPKPISSVVSGSPIIANSHPSAAAAAALGAHHPFSASPNFTHAVPTVPNNFLSSPYGVHPAAAHTSQFLSSPNDDYAQTEDVEELLEQQPRETLSPDDTNDTLSQISDSYHHQHLALAPVIYQDPFATNDVVLIQSLEELAKLQAAQLSSLYGSFLQPTAMMQLGVGTGSALSPAAAAFSPSTSAAAATAGHHSNSTTQELSIPNDVIGCVIGPHGNRINDISGSASSTGASGASSAGSSGGAAAVVGAGQTAAAAAEWHSLADPQHHSHTHTQQNIAAAAYLNNLAAYQSAAIYWPWFISAATAASAYQHPSAFHSTTHYAPTLTHSGLATGASATDLHVSTHSVIPPQQQPVSSTSQPSSTQSPVASTTTPSQP